MGSLFMTPRQVAERWSCSTRHVRRLCEAEQLTAMRIGLTNWRIAVSAVEAYEDGHTTTVEPEQPASDSAPREVRHASTADGFTLPADYSPVFPDLWPGHEATTKKTALSSH